MLDFLQTPRAATDIDALTIMFRLTFALVLSGVIGALGLVLRRSIMMPKDLLNLILCSMIVSLLLMTIGNSIPVSFGLFAALSLIRFRTPIKDTQEMLLIFLSIAVGIASGLGLFKIAMVGTVFICASIYLLHVFQLGHRSAQDYILKMLVISFEAETEKGRLEKVITDLGMRARLSELRTSGNHGMEIVYLVETSKPERIPSLVNELRQMAFVEQAQVHSPISPVEQYL